MTCYSGFGKLTDGKHPIWVGDFDGDGCSEILFYYTGDRNWWLGKFGADNRLSWNLAGNTAGFGQVWDGRPIWVGNFSGDGKTDILFYYPGDKNWWIGQFGTDNRLNWNLAGNTAGFGQVGDGRPFWTADFSGDGKTDILFYYPGDKNWWLGRFDSNNRLNWTLAGNTAGFGQVADGRPFWTGYFSNDGKADILFYYPGDKNWWLGQFDVNNKLNWNLVGNTAGFGQVWDGRPFWTGDFTGDNRTDILFYYPGDKNWWLGKFDNNNRLNWSLVGNTTGFGQVGDGRPIWAGDFTGDGRVDVLFYFPGDKNWWLGQFGNNNQLTWGLVGNTAGFGQVGDGRPFWNARFSRSDRNQMLFYYPGDGNWWLGTLNVGQSDWALSGNTGRPCQESVIVHFKSLLPINAAINQFIDAQYIAMHDLFAEGGIAAYRGTTEDLSGNTTLQVLQNLNVGQCRRGQPTTDHTTLFANRNNAGANDIVVYIVSTLIGGSGNLLGCATHPTGQPGAAVVQSTARWLVAHEVGHVLGLNHVCEFPSTANPTPAVACVAGSAQANSLMFPNVGWTNVPPDLAASEYTTMLNSTLTNAC